MTAGFSWNQRNTRGHRLRLQGILDLYVARADDNK
jgi:hypothetical protein